MKVTVKDDRVVFGMRCTWWDGIEKVAPIPGLLGSRGQRLSGCPHCHSPLMQVPTPKDWWDSVATHEMQGYKGFREFIEWLKGKCFPSFELAKEAYERSGRRVVLHVEGKSYIERLGLNK